MRPHSTCIMKFVPNVAENSGARLRAPTMREGLAASTRLNRQRPRPPLWLRLVRARKNILVIGLVAAGTVAAGESAAQAGSEQAGRERQKAHFIFRQQAGVGANEHTIEMISSGYSFAGKLVTQAPYSAESITEMVQTLPGGNRIIRENTAMIYRDSQGRTRREQQLEAIGPWATAGETAKMIFIHDPVAGVHYVVNPQDQSARKMSSLHMDAQIATKKTAAAQGERAQPGVQIRRYRVVTGNTDQHEEHRRVSGDFTTDGGSGVMAGVRAIAGAGEHALHDVKTESLGTRVIEGVEARGSKTVTTIPAGAIGNEHPIEIISEQWFSEELQMTVLSTREDPRFGSSTLRLANVQRVEPHPSLFEVPPGYTIEEGLGPLPAVRRRIDRSATTTR